MDAIANQMSKLRLMTGGQVELPITVIATIGGGSANAAQHSDTPYPMLMNLGGLNVAVPATPADAKGLVKTAIRSKNPCFVLEPNGRGGESGEVPEGEHLVPFGKAAVRREGDAVTVVAIGRMLKPALAAAAALEAEGVSAEVLDPRTLVPFDYAAVLASVGKTGHLVVVDEARECCSAASQIAAVVAEQGFSLLKGPIRRVTTPNVAIPYAPERRGARDPGRGPHHRRRAPGARPEPEGACMTVRVRVKLPKIGMTMEEATIVRFCRQPGEAFRKGDPLYEIETEKISQEVEATGDGVMVEHAVPEGSDVRVGELVCVVETDGVPG